MPNAHRNPALKAIFSIVFLCLLLWNLGAGLSPILRAQDSETASPTVTPSDDSTPPESPDLQTPAEPDPASTDENEPAPIHQPPLPAIFRSGAYMQKELVVRFKPGTNPSRIDACFQGATAQVQSEIQELNTFVLRIESEDIPSAFYHVLDCPGALYVEPNFLLQAADTLPNDPGWGNQYGLVNIRAPQGWDYSTGSASVTIAIVDSGVDYGHPDLAAKLVSGYDFVNNDDVPQDDNGHGTHVAGIAAASSNNGAGIAGVSWGARLMPVKVLNSAGGGTYADTAAGVVWAVDHGAQVINLSLGGRDESAILKDAIDYAHGRGAVIVAAAGNAGNTPVLFPARYTNVIAVARTDSGNHWSGSNFGPEIDLSAPGSSIYSTVIGGYDTKSGSSMATGFVSGLTAILMGIPGNASPDLVEYQMESTALDIEFAGRDEYTGAGLIQMDGAIQLALQSIDVSGEASERTGGAGIGQVQAALTNTPTPTWTLPPSLGTQTETPTLTSEPGSSATFPATIAASLTGSANEVQAQGETGRRNYFLPCAGMALILFGVLLVLAFRRK